MYYRRKILLNLISAFDDKGIEKIKLQKLLFLLCREQAKPVFDFVPYKYGCFSFQANKDLMLLSAHYQLIEESGNKWFSKQRAPELRDQDRVLVDKLTETFRAENNRRMIDYVYRRYPYFSVKSRWDMSDAQKERARIEREKVNRQSKQMLFTIGYEGKSIDGYLNELVKNNIRLLCDVRKNPLSMKYGFSKNQLKTCCENLNIAYVHIPELGVASSKRKNLESRRDYQRLFKNYRRELPAKQTSLKQVLEHLRQYQRIALTCFEKQHQDCHRHCIGDYLQAEEKLDCSHL